MKNVRFLFIAFAIITLSSCGGKKKLTIENSKDVLSEAIGYPMVFTKNIRWSGARYKNDRLNGTQENLVDNGFLEEGDILVNKLQILGQHPSYNYIALEPTESMYYYLPEGDEPLTCIPKTVGNVVSYYCSGDYAVFVEYIDEVTAVSKEENNRVTIKFIGKRYFTPFGHNFKNSSQYSESFTEVVDLMRIDDEDWMLTELYEFDTPFDQYNISSFPSLALMLN